MCLALASASCLTPGCTSASLPLRLTSPRLASPHLTTPHLGPWIVCTPPLFVSGSSDSGDSSFAVRSFAMLASLLTVSLSRSRCETKESPCPSRDSCRFRPVGETGFEPATSNSRSWRANRTALHPELFYAALIVLRAHKDKSKIRYCQINRQKNGFWAEKNSSARPPRGNAPPFRHPVSPSVPPRGCFLPTLRGPRAAASHPPRPLRAWKTAPYLLSLRP